jgi:hypothetical protein
MAQASDRSIPLTSSDLGQQAEASAPVRQTAAHKAQHSGLATELRATRVE